MTELLNIRPSNLNTVSVLLDNRNISDMTELIRARSEERLNFFWLGRQAYQPVWELQKSLHRLRVDDEIQNVVLLLEHSHVYTLGKNADRNHLLPSHPGDARVVQTDRGGDVTYHGPGQLIGYPIIDLHNYKMSVSWYMRTLEQIVIDVLSGYGISAGRKDGLTGVWVGDDKICAMGVRLSRWVTMHGFALNLKPDMRYFDGMIPCGIFQYGVTSIADHYRGNLTLEELANRIAEAFSNLLQWEYYSDRN